MAATTESSLLAHVPRSTPTEEILEVVERDGGVIIDSFLTSDTVTAFNAEVDHALAGLRPGTTHTDVPPDHHGTNTKRLCNMMTLSPTFRERIITDPVMLAIADQVMTRLSDAYWMNTAQLIEIGPRSARQPLHRDMQNYPVFIGAGPAGPDVMINFLLAMSPVTESNGATRVIPGSNHWENYRDIDEDRCQHITVPAEMNPGDCLFITGEVIHGGGANATSDEYRRVLTIPFNPGFLVPEEAYPFLVPMDVVRSLPPKVQQLIGFRSFHNRSNYGGSLWQDNYGELAASLGL